MQSKLARKAMTVLGGMLVYLALAPGAGVAQSMESMPDKDNLTPLVAQWVDLHRQIALEEVRWKEEQEHLRNEKVLLEKEKALLQKEIAEQAQSAKSQKAQWARFLSEKKQLQQSLEGLLPAIRSAEADLLRWQEILPLPLGRPLEANFEKVRHPQLRTAAQRLQTVLALYAQIEIYRNTIQTGQEAVIVPSGKTMELDVMYIGLARGFGLSRDGKLAGVASWTGAGWTWAWRAELAPQIREAFDYYSHKKIADFVRLPMAVSEDAP